jgi:protein SCO1/2
MSSLNQKPSARLQSTLLMVLGAVIAAIFFSYLYYSLYQREHEVSKKLDTYQTVPHFSLIERSGKQISLEDLKGHIWIANFIYTSCPATCSTMTSRFQELQSALRKTPDIKLVSFTVDPKHDTPEILKTYADRNFAKPDQWFFLTGDANTIYKLAREGFLLSFAEVMDEKEKIEFGPYTHSTKFAIVDPNGVVRAYHDGMESDAIYKIISDVGTLLRENKK